MRRHTDKRLWLTEIFIHHIVVTNKACKYLTTLNKNLGEIMALSLYMYRVYETPQRRKWTTDANQSEDTS
jgi:hypothetical protein